MKQTVYLDVLICLNLFINYFILLACAKFTKIPIRRRRLALGAAVGAASSFIILLPPLPVVPNFLIKLMIAFFVVLATFGLHDLKAFFKNTAIFLLISLCFGGAMIALWFLLKPSGMVINNGAVYFNISPLLLALSTLVCYALLRVFTRLLQARLPQKTVSRVKIVNGGRTCELLGKLDTGNSLIEPFSQSPVIVADFQAVQPVVPEEIKAYYAAPGATSFMQKSTAYPKIRLVPFASVGGEGILPAFKPKQVFIDDHLCVKEIYIALCPGERLSGECRAVINTECIDG